MDVERNTMANSSFVESAQDLNRRYADQFLPLVIYLVVHAVVGIVGNAIVLVVYSVSREYRNTTFKVFVLYLAALDMLSCLTFIPTEVARLQNFYWDTDKTLCQLKCFFNVFYNTALALALFVIAIHRYRKVCQPFKTQIHPPLALKIVFVSMVTTGLLSIPAPVMCGIQTVNKTNIYNTSTPVQTCQADPSFSKVVIQINVIAISLLLVVVCVTLIVIYALISKALITQWRKMKRSEELNALQMTKFCSSDALQDSTDGKTELFVVEHTTYPANTARASSINTNNISTSQNAKSKSRDKKCKSGQKSGSGKPYKTLIWLFLTGLFIVTNALYVMAAFAMSKEDKRSPNEMLVYKFLIRIYFFNNIINPIVYAWLDKRFRASCRNIIIQVRQVLCRR